jgi:hypothetical protein
MSTTRRVFLSLAAAAGGLLRRSPAAGLAVPTATPTPPPAVPTPTPTPAPPSALQKLARERYGKFVAEDELPMLDEEIAVLERRSARLHGFALENSEEPASDFRVRS